MSHSLSLVIAELDTIQLDLSLKLPASPQAIRSQLQRIIAAQRQLESLKSKVFRLLRMSSPIERLTYLALFKMVDRLICEADNLRFLAEEFPIDPIGTTACLERVTQRSTHLIQQIRGLSGERLAQSPTLKEPRKQKIA